MFRTLRDAWRIPELRKKLMFTMIILLLYRFGSVIPAPFVNAETVGATMSQAMQNTILGLYDMMSGSALSQATILALGIQPYINSSIIIQLLTVAIPALERMAKEEGEEGKKKINKITRFTTVGLGLLLGYAYYTMIKSYGLLVDDSFWAGVVVVLAFTAGSSLVMWMGEQITEHGIGNGISMILFANILSGLPSLLSRLLGLEWWLALAMTVILAGMVVFVVFTNDAERRIPIQYAKRVVGRKVYGGQNTNLPIKVNMSGVMPVIFAQSICSIPATIFAFTGTKPDEVTGLTGNWWYDNVFRSTSVTYLVIYGLMIFFFSWFYAQIQYDPVEISNNLKKNGGFIPGFRPGKPTGDFIKKVISKIVIFGAICLAIVAMLPMILGAVGSACVIKAVEIDAASAALTGEALASAQKTVENYMLFGGLRDLAIGGTSLIIIVGVALETVKALEAQMLMRHYKGFLD